MKISKNGILYLEKENRYINLNNVIMVTKIIQNNKAKIAFNFENLVEKRNKGDLIPDFHYVFGEPAEINAFFEYIANKTTSSGLFLEINTTNGTRLVNPKKINSFFLDDETNILYLNFNSSIYGEQAGNLSTLSVKCIVNNEKDIFLSKLLQSI